MAVKVKKPTKKQIERIRERIQKAKEYRIKNHNQN